MVHYYLHGYLYTLNNIYFKSSIKHGLLQVHILYKK